MKLVPQWKRVLTHAFSMWIVYAAAALGILANAIPYMAPFLPWWVPIVVLIAAPIARILDQGGIDADK
jgi:hypothetical protein